MAIRTTTTRINAYHNYKCEDILSNEIIVGEELDDTFYLIAKEVPYPEKFPNISVNTFNRKGEKILTIRNNRICYLHEKLRSERRGRNLTILDSNNRIVFKWESRAYTNVYITSLGGELYDEKGNAVSPLDSLAP